MPGTPLDKEQVRMLVLDVGYQEAAQRLGIKYATIRQWSKRFKWKQPFVDSRKTKLVVTTPSQALSQALIDDSNSTRKALSHAAKNGASHLSQAPPDAIVRNHKALRDLTATAAQIHNWNEDTKPGSPLNLNVLSQNTVIAINQPEP
jgi:hypothetical protein